MNPFLLSSLFVFSHTTSFFAPQFVIQKLTDWVLTILQNSGILRHLAISSAKSQGFEVFLKLGSPWGFPKKDAFICSSFACLFILIKKAFMSDTYKGVLLSKAPPHFASAMAASFPLGSMSPQSSCSMLSKSPTTSSALVPLISEASSSTVVRHPCKSIFFSEAIPQTVQKVMILVRLAISEGFLNRHPLTTCKLGYSITIKLSALIFLSSFLSKCRRGFCKSIVLLISKLLLGLIKLTVGFFLISLLLPWLRVEIAGTFLWFIKGIISLVCRKFNWLSSTFGVSTISLLVLDYLSGFFLPFNCSAVDSLFLLANSCRRLS